MTSENSLWKQILNFRCKVNWYSYSTVPSQENFRQLITWLQINKIAINVGTQINIPEVPNEM